MFSDDRCGGSSNFTDVPKNLAVYAGSDCVLKCAISDNSFPLGWKKNSTEVYTGYEFSNPFNSTGRFEIIQEKNRTYMYNLRIRHAQPSDAGEYECGRNVPEVASAQLVIIGKS